MLTMIDPAVRKALTDGVLLGVQQAATACFNVYRQRRSESVSCHKQKSGNALQ
jgi:hypothetical protein